MTENEYLHERINGAFFILTRLAEIIGALLPGARHGIEQLFDEANERMGEIKREYEREKQNAAAD